MMKRAFVVALVLASTRLLGAQAPNVAHDIARVTGAVEISTPDNVKVTADQAQVNRTTGEVLLSGNVVLRQNLRPAMQPIAATNNAGEPFPAPQAVTLRLRGNFELTVGDLTVHAEEADINGMSGEIALRGNVRMRNPKWAGKPLP